MREAILDGLFQERPLRLLLVVSSLIGVGLALTVLDLPFILGTGPFWDNPRGTIGGSANDIGGIVVGYRYFVNSALGFPLFFTPNLGWPDGTNIIFTDSIPIVALVGWLASSLTGSYINPYGAWVFLCLVLPAPLMTWVVTVSGHRNLIAAIAAAMLAICAPVLLWRWGHISLMGQFILIGALGLYLRGFKLPVWWQGALAWAGWLALALLVHVYLFFMAGAIYAASVAQRWWLGQTSRLHAAAEVGIAGGVLVMLMVIAGHLSPHNERSVAWGFGYYSLNLLSPFIPQKSGVFPALSGIVDATGGQYEGFAYLGVGLLLLLAVTIPFWFRHRQEALRWHGALIAVFAVFVVFALSYKVYAGPYLLFEVPLGKPEATKAAAAYTLAGADRASLLEVPMSIAMLLAGTFRSSGRFFWPIVYALTAVGIIGALRYLPRPWAVGVLAACMLLQWQDVRPLQAQISASIRNAAPLDIDPAEWTPRIAGAKRVMVYPSFQCAGSGTRVSMAFQLLSAKANVPTNAVYNTRRQGNCEREHADALRVPVEKGVLYVYLVTGDRWQLLPASTPTRECAPFKHGVFCRAL